MSHVALMPAFNELIDVDAPLEQLGTGYGFTEGPIWHPIDHYLLFSDMPSDVRRRWDGRDGVREVMRPAYKCNGMTYDEELNLLICEHATSSVVREYRDGRRETIASHFEGGELNSPNDICVRLDGSIYFSDPWYGRMPVFGVERPRELGFQGIYRIPPAGGPLRLLVDRDLFTQPNGLCFNPTEDWLYVNDTEQANIRRFRLNEDGSLGDVQIFASDIRSEHEQGLADGMKTDERGNVWCTGPGGIWVYSPRGDLLGKVRTPEMVGNLAWGGPDFRTLFICASSSVYRISTKVSGHREPYMVARLEDNNRSVAALKGVTDAQFQVPHGAAQPVQEFLENCYRPLGLELWVASFGRALRSTRYQESLGLHGGASSHARSSSSSSFASLRSSVSKPSVNQS